MTRTAHESTHEAARLPTAELSDLVEHYGQSPDLPPSDWLMRLKLQRPRRDIRCLDPVTVCVKRCMDVGVSIILLIVLAPVMAMVALLVRCTSPGPIIYSQVRTGLNLRQKRDRRREDDLEGIPDDEGDRRRAPRRQEAAFGRDFVLYKFRTMRTDSEKAGAQFAVKGDPRVTPIGRFLRKTRLDELPQLWNVLRGDMTLVGPRPERPIFIEQLSREIPGYLHRLGLKPGLTGLAQVLNGYDNNLESFRRKVALDLLYLQNCCLWNDVKILFRTIRVVLTGSGAL